MNFYLGFEKAAEANSLIGRNKNIASGMKMFEQGSKIKSPSTINPGQAIAPRSEMPQIPTMAGTGNEHNLKPALPNATAQRVKVPKPKGETKWRELKTQP